MFTSTNIPQNMDKSAMTSDQRTQFAEQHPALLGQKHQVTIKNLKDLQDVEKYMFNNLQSLNKSSPESVQESQMIKTRLDELSSTRMALFKQLKTMYKDQQRQTSDSRGNLADQITMTKVVENELDNAKKELSALEQERLNKKRLVELGEYEYDRYRSHKNIMKVIAYGALAVLLFVILMQQPWFPPAIGVGAIVLIIAIVVITIFGRLANNFSRTNLNWDKFDWRGVPPGGGKRGPRKSWDWGSMFSDTCKNIAYQAYKVKDNLLNVKEKARAAGKVNASIMAAADSSMGTQQDNIRNLVNAAQSSESFTTMVNPSQPKGAEAFYNIF